MDGVVIYTQRGGLLLHGCGVARIQRRGKDTNKAEPPPAPRPRRRRDRDASDGTRGQQSRGATRARVVAAVAAMVALGTTALRAAASASPSSTARIR